ncbi:putative ABC transporteur, membrane component [Cupriavidus phytorum]|uniref:ABC transporteur, membrane component n=2 Tax=Cupriavidus TaxID=106589 RepID=A0A975X7Y0_9BURK|nr:MULTISPECIES: branched-chain amino acid ABC transporter permease [Cupriavidus]PZX32238.1 amino acid/amide ABC transporter membrane protein 1 (HAAT family) [Cupriavidus alkaliphilus]SOY61928.1 putative ABC transporteur, membrane component [Cupriavidus taiwanensis]
MTTSSTTLPSATPAAPPGVRLDWTPLALAPLLMLLAFPLVGSPSTWLTLTIAGLAMGMIIFVVSSGLTLVFGLMDVLNFGHGAFIALGAYVAASVLLPLAGWVEADSLALNLSVFALAIAAAMVAAGAVGLFFERVVVRPVYGQHLKQILITMGGMIVAEQLIKAIWGPETIALQVPTTFRGAVLLGDAAIEKYRLIAMALGLVIFIAMLLLLNRTRIGLLIRAGVENREMVEALGYRVRRLFVGVFVAGAALAGLGGVLWGLYQQNITAAIGAQVNVLIFIVIIIGGLGSTTGCFVGALLVGLMANYTGFLFPKVALFSNILLMMLILLWRPQGLFPVARR